MIYILDTDVLVDLARGTKISVPKSASQKHSYESSRRIRTRCLECQELGNILGLSAITIAELEFGARRSGNYEDEMSALTLILRPFTIYDFEASNSPSRYGEIREILESSGQIIGAMDLLIAAHACALGATLVTNNRRHFGRVPDLRVETWG